MKCATCRGTGKKTGSRAQKVESEIGLLRPHLDEIPLLTKMQKLRDWVPPTLPSAIKSGQIFCICGILM
jgi:hypothetical protein